MGRPFKILSDFDGVWTNQGPEADVLLSWMLEKLVEFAGGEPAERKAELDGLIAQMVASPAEHGWAPDGRISAFIDEDPLVVSSSLCRHLNVDAGPTAARFKAAVLEAGFESLSAFSEHAYVQATASYRDAHPPCLVDGALDKLTALHEAGADVVIISNSGADKISAWFQAAGVDAGPEPDRLLRVRGSAAKWWLGEGQETISVGHRSIYVDRPKYRTAIEAESPDLIIGDVFSLDLALPHVLRSQGNPAAPSRLALRAHAHTPSWVTEGRAGGAIDHVVAGVEELPGIVKAAISK